MYTQNKNRTRGKFEGNQSEAMARVVYKASLDPFYCVDELGSVEEDGYWFGLVAGKMHGWIIMEDSKGFVDVTSFRTFEEAKGAFTRIPRQLGGV